MRIEAERVARVADKGFAVFEAKVGEFYRGYHDVVRPVWMPLAQAIGEAVRGETGPDMGEWAEGYVRTMAESRQREALDELRGLAGVSDLPGRAKEVTERWLRSGPAEMGDRESRVLIEAARGWVLRQTAA